MPILAATTIAQPLLGAALAVPGLPARADEPVLEVLEWRLQDEAEGPPADPDDASADAGNEIVVAGSYGPPEGDPAEKLNAESYRIVQSLDSAMVEPVAYAYRDGVPEPIRDGLGNVVQNLREPSNALNFLLQGKVGKAFETLGRLAINSTLGIGGLIDIAEKPGIGLPYRRNGFANTMGYYGVGPGAYLYLPVTGATTARDLLGDTLDQALLPFMIGKPFNQTEYAATYFVVNGLDQRLAFDEELGEIAASDDPYAVRRDTYLAQRLREIAALKGEVVEEEEDKPGAEIAPVTVPAEPQAADPDAPPLSLIEQIQLTARAGIATR